MKNLEEAGIPDHLLCLLCMWVKKPQLELDMEKQAYSKLGKEYIKVVYCHPAYLTSMKSTSYKMLGWVNGIKIAGRNITSDMQMTPPL